MAKITGFFTDAELDTVGINGPGSGDCDKCGLHTAGCITPMMSYAGEGKKKILIVLEQPSENDDIKGAPLSGDTGEWIRKKLRAKGMDLDRDFWFVNSVACHPVKEKNKRPTKAQVKFCNAKLQKTIEELKPRFIWLMGSDAVYSMYSWREDNCEITRWRGICIPDVERQAWVLPLYHPQHAIRMAKDEHFQATFDRDLSHAIRCSQFPDPPEAMDIRGVEIIKKYERVVEVLEEVLCKVPKKLAHDYEANSLKPFKVGSRLASVSFCYEWDKAYSFPYDYNKHFTPEQIEHIGDLWIEIMEHPKIKKISHNSKFEDMWTRTIFGVETVNMWWCTMNTAHILDTRTEFSGLKFQALIRWGTPFYDESIEKYIKADKGTPFNEVMKAPLNDLLLYGGIDSLLTYRLQEEQEEELAPFPKMVAAREAQMGWLNTMCDMQENGINMNKDYYTEQNIILGERISSMNAKLLDFPEAQQFMRKRGRPINFGSGPDLADLFFNIMQLPRGKQTAGGADCTDASVLASLNTPIAKEITKISKLEKIKGTYLAQFLREIDEQGRMHPFYDLHTTNTIRGSSSKPNFQNIPVRDQEAMLITRGGIIPSVYDYLMQIWKDYVGNRLVDWDYSAMEVRIIACITQDPVLMAYINDPSTDMHRDQAMELFCFTKAEWDKITSIDKKHAKNIRFHAKNGMVFALFYGSYYRSIAKTMFPLLKELTTGEMTLFEHLRSKGIIRSLSSAADDFENHVKLAEKKFWIRFKGVKAWQEKAFKDYLEKGYIEYLTGFRVGGWLTRNDICNYPVQGPAFHCLLWSVTELNRRMKEERMYSKLIGQIHDCCLGDIVPQEHDRWCQLSHQIATKDIREHFKWINVPLDIEFEKGEINEPWSKKKEFHIPIYN